jgi:hypothetical protein
MRKFVVAIRFTIFLIGVSFFITSKVSAEETEMDMDLMQTIEDTNDSLSSNIALEDAESSTVDAQTLVELFAVVVDHFKHQSDAAEAVDLSIKSKDLAANIITQVGTGDFESAANSATDLSRACKTCHNFYKED